ncbi:MAG TPA: cyanophycin synthetase, partial [Candidatus Ozemobacteraceae bacterium]|nr:cyanophycin synthetase [Candidatus Ozemobacteraceae bacterium]
TPLFDDRDIRLLGRHNRENVMAAATAAILAGVPPAGLKQVVQTFPGVEHRLEWVRERSGVAYVNDSKGTNCAASIIALQACTTPVILIAGGRDKGTDLRDWVEAVRLKARGVVLLGEAKERFRAALEGVVPLKMAGTFADAVRLASDWALSGETVLLSPACSSYDMFPNFEVRGACFKDLVMKL